MFYGMRTDSRQFCLVANEKLQGEKQRDRNPFGEKIKDGHINLLTAYIHIRSRVY